MKKQSKEIIILGAGLAGLTLAYELKKSGTEALILEARDRTGGRIHTLNNSGTTLELGATWFADKHQHLCTLLEELQLEKVEQYYGQYALYQHPNGQVQNYELPNQTEASYRIKGGTHKLIHTLSEQLSSDSIMLNQAVNSLHFQDKRVKIATKEKDFHADIVVNTLPPNLFAKTVTIEPALPDEIKKLYEATHTWMGESIKVGFFSKRAFWKEKGIGTLYSQRGPITEMYDHSNDTGYALKGFMAEPYNQLSKAEREHAAREQLKSFFDKNSVDQMTYAEEPWRDQMYTFSPYRGSIFPHQHNGHHLLREPLFDGKLVMGGSETATYFPGYLDGAVEASQEVMQLLVNHLKR
mgnify:CR=1 FL=1